ncbi:hypothetical protein LQ567_24190 [Niabella pedocola]|uniref:Uncharacterized protein n=1 Tax=Niabella pedocola TaxID=1752077 RepID=A0ABS8PYF1_9BACT|nr:hypothetical protein [Niabella pedocola]MCD2425905.1 hypothetical protein [Niabella pedocola]
MTTIAQWPADRLQTVLYRLLIHKDAAQEPLTDYSEGKGHFETASIVDPFGALFSMMTGKYTSAVLDQTHTTR